MSKNSMNNNNRKRVREIFFEAYKKKTQEERSQYLDEVCGTDPGLKREIQSLLEAHDRSDSLLENLPVFDNVILDDSPISEGPGTIIGRYKLLEKIGEGGMAVVYMAEQEKPIRRKVALKIIKLGMDTKQVIARFEAERQALAMMDHPNIAKVLDAGATETGRPYFVMELVTGVSITEYCDKNNLSTKERLALYIEVCNAIQHAHQKGIIHRDIKPSNIMVTQREGKPVPKVIDFGIAKAVNQRLTEKTLFTRYAHIIGTPAYMSPEQANLTDLDVDTRSDIYSLGVLLYELLTSTTPFSEEELRKAGYLEMQLIIQEKEPDKPSAKLSTLGSTLTDIAKHHNCTPDLLTKTIRGDLDWIVMKSLEKKRSRRYEVVKDFVGDIQRYLENRPVMAHAPSTGYKLYKFYRRHQKQSIAVLTILFLAFTLICVLFVLCYKQQQWEKEEIARYRLDLSEAESFLKVGQLSIAFDIANPLLDTKYAKHEAQLIIDSIGVIAQDKVNQYTEKIESDPENANNYFLRAQQYYYLREDEKVCADMDRYRAILNPPRGTEEYNNWLKALVGQKTPYSLLFGKPMNLGPEINSMYGDHGPCISFDGLSLYFSSNRTGGVGDIDIWVTTRTTIDATWDKPTNLGKFVNTPYMENCPWISANGLSLYFFSNRPDGFGRDDIWVVKRAKINDPWQEPINLGEIVNSPEYECYPSITADELELYFYSTRRGGYGNSDIWMSKRDTPNDPWQEPKNLGEIINTQSNEGRPSISPDGLVLFFNSNRIGARQDDHLWVTSRQTRSSDWGEPFYIESLKGASGLGISGDGSILVFTSTFRGDIGLGLLDIWEVPIIPNLDFNNDGNIDANDLKMINDNLGVVESQDKSIYDVGPMPWGDGIVDEKDLEVFIRYFKQEDMK